MYPPANRLRFASRFRRRTHYGIGIALVVGLLLPARFIGATGSSSQFMHWLREDAPLVSTVRAELRSIVHPPMSPEELGDGADARELQLLSPSGMAVDEQGNVYVADRGDGTSGRIVWRITTTGTVERVLGDGKHDRPASGNLALETSLGSPEGLRIDSQGRLYVADSYANVVLRVEGDGTFTRLAGAPELGLGGYSGDGGPAVDAELSAPYDIAIDDAGNVYIADFGNHRIRRIDAEGVIDTIAGTGKAGYSGDGGPATAARLNGPYGVALDTEQRLLIADSLNHVIRRVERDGTITTIAGTGQLGYSGDGGPALQAAFDTPQALFVDDSGLIYIGDEHNHALRVLHDDGTIEGLAGDGTAGQASEGTPVDDIALNDPEMVAVVDDGLLVTENDNARVIRISEDGKLSVFAGRGQ